MNKYFITFAILFVTLSVILSGCSQTCADPVTVEKTFTWTAVGDDGQIGQASVYDFRISEDSASLVTDFLFQTVVVGLPLPAPAGTPESFVFTAELEPGRYYCAIKAIDDAGNWGGISNIVSFEVTDSRPPAAVTDLSVSE